MYANAFFLLRAACNPLLAPRSHSQLPPPIPQRPTPPHLSLTDIADFRLWVFVNLPLPMSKRQHTTQPFLRVRRSATVLPVFLSLFSIFLLEGRQVWEQTAPLDLLHDVHKLSEPHNPVVPRAPHF